MRLVLALALLPLALMLARQGPEVDGARFAADPRVASAR